MTRDEVDTMWQKAMQESIKYGEMFTRYHFAKLVAEKEREACAKYLDDQNTGMTDMLAAEIRARGQA